MSKSRLSGIPEGFDPIPTRGPFTDLNGPIWRKSLSEDEPPSLGFMPEERHTNALGFVHGGMLSTVLDSAMAHVAYDRFQCRLVTLELNVKFHHAVFRGRWADIEVAFQKIEDSSVDLTARLRSRNSLCVEAQATYRLFPNHKR